jgi:hypothetical protein
VLGAEPAHSAAGHADGRAQLGHADEAVKITASSKFTAQDPLNRYLPSSRGRSSRGSPSKASLIAPIWKSAFPPSITVPNCSL